MPKILILFSVLIFLSTYVAAMEVMDTTRYLNYISKELNDGVQDLRPALKNYVTSIQSIANITELPTDIFKSKSLTGETFWGGHLQIGRLKMRLAFVYYGNKHMIILGYQGQKILPFVARNGSTDDCKNRTTYRCPAPKGIPLDPTARPWFKSAEPAGGDPVLIGPYWSGDGTRLDITVAKAFGPKNVAVGALDLRIDSFETLLKLGLTKQHTFKSYSMVLSTCNDLIVYLIRNDTLLSSFPPGLPTNINTNVTLADLEKKNVGGESCDKDGKNCKNTAKVIFDAGKLFQTDIKNNLGCLKKGINASICFQTIVGNKTWKHQHKIFSIMSSNWTLVVLEKIKSTEVPGSSEIGTTTKTLLIVGICFAVCFFAVCVCGLFVRSKRQDKFDREKKKLQEKEQEAKK